ncbi:hypothetical protein ACQEVB_35210 [Pseudonocardia sp. CA-107938]|uniref:hypothetical protein n=1 Tax=Pseudonocardia sp. CA-107938 TaxID=3240021 RepID=UPI003D8FB4F6
MNEFSQLLAGLPGVVETLLQLHRPDDQGRCRACTKAGTGLPEKAWPCALYWFADGATPASPRSSSR